MKIYILSFLFLLLLLLLPLGLTAQPTTPAAKTLNIFTLGDSNGSYEHSWPQQLRAYLPEAQVFNISRGGRTIGFINNGDSTLNSLMVLDENMRKAAEFTKDRPFDYIILELGTNDAKAVFANQQKEVPKNLDKLLKRIKGSSHPAISQAKIIIISPPPFGTKAEATEKYKGGDKRVAQMSKSFAKVARRNKAIFVNGYKTPGLDINTMTDDGIHLDVVASKRIIEPVVVLVRSKAK